MVGVVRACHVFVVSLFTAVLSSFLLSFCHLLAFSLPLSLSLSLVLSLSLSSLLLFLQEHKALQQGLTTALEARESVLKREHRSELNELQRTCKTALAELGDARAELQLASASASARAPVQES